MAKDRELVKLHLYQNLEDRTDLSAEDAVQGELFPTEDGEEPRRGYRGTVATKVAGITYRQLDYWARKQILQPSITPSHGSGSRRLYSFKDVVILAVSKKLLDIGVNLQNVTSAIGYLCRKSTSELEHATIMCDGKQVYECSDSDELITSIVESGNAIFGLSVDSLWHQIEDSLEDQDYVDLTQSSVFVDKSRPIDELTAMRLRKKLEEQRAARESA